MESYFKTRINAIGLMSGTSLDGLDLVSADFWQDDKGNWKFGILAADTVEYPADWNFQLKNAPVINGQELIELNTKYGRFLGEQTAKFIQKTDKKPAIVASHGHTIFHQPEAGFTFQLGNGHEIASITGITTICDFRSGDVALGGQGAPLVPAGDKYLFHEFDYCLNLGGFANISFDENNIRKAFDICPANIVLNQFAQKNGVSFDKNGELGRAGKIDNYLFEELNSLSYYHKVPPKSLGREWVESAFLPILEKYECPESDIIRTVYEHIAHQISTIIAGNKTMLVTGGGAWNIFLMELISAKTAAKLVVPSSEIVDYKEALVFAFLGVLRYNNQINCFSSVTGATRDSSAGVVYLP